MMHWDDSRSNGFQGRYPVQLNIMCHPKAQWLHIGKPPSMPGWAKGKPYKEMLAYRAELFKASNKEQVALQRQQERQEEQRRLAAVAEAYTRAPAEARFAEQAAERMSQFEAEEERKKEERRKKAASFHEKAKVAQQEMAEKAKLSKLAHAKAKQQKQEAEEQKKKENVEAAKQQKREEAANTQSPEHTPQLAAHAALKGNECFKLQQHQKAIEWYNQAIQLDPTGWTHYIQRSRCWAHMKRWIEAKKDAKKFYKKDVELLQDPDVLDTWFSSGLWPFATLGWPNKNDYVKKFYPTNVLVTGFDIIFFWVARMIMFGMEFMNKEPFKNIYVHALVKDEKGQKMSKSKGNVVDPLVLIEKYSADALRFTLLSMASPGTDVKLSEDRVKGYRNFLNKLWNANNFLITNKCDFKNTKKIPKLTKNINKWIHIELLNTINKVEKNLKNYRFDEAAKNAYQFVWHSYCDWYLELSKTILFSEDEKGKKEVKEVSTYIFKQILILMHPFIPFITEEIWLKNKFDNSKKNFLMLANWPSGIVKKDQDHKDVEKMINIISSIRSFKNELGVNPGSFIDISTIKISKKNRSFLNNNEIVLKKLGRINNFYSTDLKKPSAALMIFGDLLKVYFDGNVDLRTIKDNLIKKQNKHEEEMDKISLRLDNKAFIDRAPKNIVDQEKTNYNTLKNDIEKISLIIESL